MRGSKRRSFASNPTLKPKGTDVPFTTLMERIKPVVREKIDLVHPNYSTLKAF